MSGKKYAMAAMFALLALSGNSAYGQGGGGNAGTGGGGNPQDQGGGNEQGGPGGSQGQGQGQRGGGANSAEREARRQKLMERFDLNHDGKLDDGERAKMKEFLEQRRQARQARENGGGQQGQGSGPGSRSRARRLAGTGRPG
jgi:hypothetical protein